MKIMCSQRFRLQFGNITRLFWGVGLTACDRSDLFAVLSSVSLRSLACPERFCKEWKHYYLNLSSEAPKSALESSMLLCQQRNKEHLLNGVEADRGPSRKQQSQNLSYILYPNEFLMYKRFTCKEKYL